MERVTSIATMRRGVATSRAEGRRIAFVPTMGALHEGHLGLVRLAADHADTVVVSIFVNPTQFDRPDDLAAYPRDLEGDEQALAALGRAAPAIVFTPRADELYPRALRTTVHVSGLTDGLCGAGRPGHFDGVATVVTKLLNIITPDVALFGRKDAQQLRVIRRMVADLDLPVEVVAGPTVREPDGLALSSRNRRLSDEQRARALALPAALRAAVLVGVAARETGDALSPEALHAAATARLARVPEIDVEYLEVVDPDTLAPAILAPAPAPAPAADAASGPTRLLLAVAAHVGPVRLIDNVEIGDRDDEQRLLQATVALAED